ncbi:hydroxyacid oxidase 1-like protein [Zychaea mexicana]|uniref:hydroxyacid oxidase 1-like protein n=1 Tax=Zychaea mexicana TaxID=64656 RepID=UPI0022FE2A7F|nr:hydroxyacid oxidase 1-like protein [Zychaea mexicana]KAI9498982.1 hydroxyacid oxidase 1-like protein [Zychaea mexicana]
MNNIPASIADFETYARQTMNPGAFGFYVGGADSEITLRRNLEAYNSLLLRPKVMVDVEKVSIATTILGEKITSPICVAPTAYHALAHHDGEKATARACAAVGTCFCQSTNSNYTMDQVASSVPKEALRWFQIYVQEEEDVTKRLIKDCEKAGFKALVVTLDRPRLGKRLHVLKSGFTLPKHLSRANFYEDQDNDGSDSYYHGEMYPGMTWKDIKFIKSITKLPIVVKGIFREEDAKLAAENDVDAIIVSNHGGRQLDSCPATIEVLPEIVAACKGTRVEVYVDGGIRTGTDVFKALAIGARAVFIGRPALWGLAYQGENGVKQVLDMLNYEFRLTMTLSGCANVQQIDKSYVAPVERYSFTRTLAKL